MFGDWFTAWQSHVRERLNNPILGPFTAGWLVFNWRPLAIILFGDMPMTGRISFVQMRYDDWSSILIFPLVFAVVYALIVPWVTLVVQWLQEYANSRRRNHKIDSDTDYYRASVKRAEAEAQLTRIRAQDEITRRAQDELEEKRRELEEDQRKADSNLREKQKKIDRLIAESERKTNIDSQAAAAARDAAEEMRIRLKEEKFESERELKEARRRLEEEKNSLLNSLNISNVGTSIVKVDEILGKLINRKYHLYFNPHSASNPYKVITFKQDSQIGIGQNKNEHAWHLIDGRLEIYQKGGGVHSCFSYDPIHDVFLHTNDKDTKSKRGQYIIPEGTERSVKAIEVE